MGRMEKKWWTLLAVCIGVFMLLIDVTVVNTALPAIQRSLHASFSDLQWIVNAYALTLAAFLLTAGSLSDLLGRKRVFSIGLAVFTASSFVCGVSASPLMLNLARGAQGIGGAIMLSSSLALIANAFRGRDRGTAFAVYGAVLGAAVAVGPLVGGGLTSGLGWRWIFFVNVPIGIAGIALTLIHVTESRDPTGKRIDWVGLVTFSGSLFLLVYALTQGNDKGWTSTEILGCLAGAAALMAAFAVAEVRLSNPMFDVSLLRRPAFTGAAVVGFALSASIFSLYLYLTLYLQNVLGYGPLAAGLRFLPMTVLLFFVAPISGRLTVRIPVRLILSLGLALVAVSLLLQAGIHADSGYTHLLPGFLVGGLGIGLITPALASTAVAVVPPRQAGMASGINSTFRQVGIATGVAGLGAIFQHEVSSKTLAGLARSGDAAAVARATHGRLSSTFASGSTGRVASTLPAPLRHAVVTSFDSAFVSALNEILLIAAAVALVGAVLGLVLVRSRDFVAPEQAQADPAEQPVPAAA
jgi:EmrB/QacA subfamily drug resistance transporter